MTFMPWTDSLLTGIAEVDEQHRWLVDATNRLHNEIIRDKPDNKVIGDILFGLVDYTYNHFIMEEDLFSRLGYPESEAHIAQHNKFTRDVNALLERHEHGDVVNTEALTLLREWLTQHIMKTDKAYVPFMEKNGIR